MTRSIPSSKSTHKAFTLIELLVVIAIIALLAAILFPVFARARENARRSACQSNLKQIGLGILQYSQDYDEWMPTVRGGNAGNVEWHVVTQPYFKSLQVMVCPSASARSKPTTSTGDAEEPAGGYYVGGPISYYASRLHYNTPGGGAAASNWGNGAFGINSPSKLSSFAHPASTIMVIEGQLARFSYIEMNMPVTLPGVCATDGNSTFGDCHWAGHLTTSNYLFADGHVKSMRPLQTIQGDNMWFRDRSHWTATNAANLTNIRANLEAVQARYQ